MLSPHHSSRSHFFGQFLFFYGVREKEANLIISKATITTFFICNIYNVDSALAFIRQQSYLTCPNFTSLNFAFLPISDGLSATFTHLGSQVQLVVAYKTTKDCMLPTDSTNTVKSVQDVYYSSSQML